MAATHLRRTPRHLALLSAATAFIGTLATLAQAYPDDPADEPDESNEQPDESAVEEEAGDDFGSEIVWLDAGAGFQWVDLLTFQAGGDALTAGLAPTSLSGPVGSFGAGFRLWFLTLGGRAEVAGLSGAGSNADDATMWSVDAELGLRAPLGRVEPHVTLAGGYGAIGGLRVARGASPGPSLHIHGANARIGAGLDVYLTRHVSVGIDAALQVLALTREGMSLRDAVEAETLDTVSDAEAQVLEADGTSAGAAASVIGSLAARF